MNAPETIAKSRRPLGPPPRWPSRPHQPLISSACPGRSPSIRPDGFFTDRRIAARRAAHRMPLPTSTRWLRTPAPPLPPGSSFRPRIAAKLVRRYGALVREHKEALSLLLSIENGKILTEARGEVQEVIDICEYAVGLSRQLFGLTIVRTARASPDRILAPDGRARVDLGVQFSRRGVGVGDDRCTGVRRQRDLETVGENPTHRARLCRAAGESGGRL